MPHQNLNSAASVRPDSIITIGQYSIDRSLFFGLVSFILFALCLLIAGSADAQITVDNATGNLGRNLCSFGKSVQSSILVKGLAFAVAALGIIKWVATRKDGIPEIVGGGVGAILASKFTVIMSIFGVTC